MVARYTDFSYHECVALFRGCIELPELKGSMHYLEIPLVDIFPEISLLAIIPRGK
jgi:hypothetical protein